MGSAIPYSCSGVQQVLVPSSTFQLSTGYSWTIVLGMYVIHSKYDSSNSISFARIQFYQYYQTFFSLGDNWCCLICFTYYLHICSCMPVLTIPFSMFVYKLNLSRHVWLSLHATWHSGLGSSLTPLDLYIQISELGQTWILLLRTKLTLRSRQSSCSSMPFFASP